jgi:transporter family-2 protein
MSAAWLYPFILFAGVLQAAGNSMNGQLNKSMANPWLAATVSFALIVFVFAALFAIMPRPLPTAQNLADMPWWAPVGGLTGAVAVFAGLLFVNRIGAGPFNGLLITANILFSLAIDHFGLLNMEVHALNAWRVLGGAFMVAGIALIAVF